jgi:hypothetical protein
METSPPKRSYFQPLAVNSILLTMLSLAVIHSMHPDRYNPDRYTFNDSGQLVTSALALPIVNFACFILAFAYRRHHLVRVYGILTLVWSVLIIWGFITSLQGFHKIGG